MGCVYCKSDLVKKNGQRNGRQRYFCGSCQREFSVTVVADETESITNNAGNVLAISDLHLPHAHPKALDFCLGLQEEYDCKTVVFLGDIFDFAGFSMHVKNPDAPSSGDEIHAATAAVKPWAEAFPVAKICWGNHSLRLHKRMQESGVPRAMVPSLNDTLGLPDTWDWQFHHIIDGVRYLHGNTSGEYAHLRMAKSYMQPIVHAHTHSSGAVQFMSTDNSLVYGMNCGCLIDTKSFAFEYARDFARRPVVGTGVILNSGTLPIFIPMDL